MGSVDRRHTGEASGFSLIETMIAMGILAAGLISMAGVFAYGTSALATSSANLVAREKGREAVESVHSARDTNVITFAQIRNVSQGGVFVDGPQPLRTPGPDGLANTADDTGMEEAVIPGPDRVMGTDDDVRTPLTGYTREIRITELVTNGVPNPNLRQLSVIVVYHVGTVRRTYTLTTFISSFS